MAGRLFPWQEHGSKYQLSPFLETIRFLLCEGVRLRLSYSASLSHVLAEKILQADFKSKFSKCFFIVWSRPCCCLSRGPHVSATALRPGLCAFPQGRNPLSPPAWFSFFSSTIGLVMPSVVVPKAVYLSWRPHSVIKHFIKFKRKLTLCPFAAVLETEIFLLVPYVLCLTLTRMM